MLDCPIPVKLTSIFTNSVQILMNAQMSQMLGFNYIIIANCDCEPQILSTDGKP